MALYFSNVRFVIFEIRSNLQVLRSNVKIFSQRPLKYIICTFLFQFSFSISQAAKFNNSNQDFFNYVLGHISGCLQTLLFVFMFGVQVALIIQEWFVRDHSSYVKPIFNVGAGVNFTNILPTSFTRAQ